MANKHSLQTDGAAVRSDVRIWPFQHLNLFVGRSVLQIGILLRPPERNCLDEARSLYFDAISRLETAKTTTNSTVSKITQSTVTYDRHHTNLYLYPPFSSNSSSWATMGTGVASASATAGSRGAAATRANPHNTKHPDSFMTNDLDEVRWEMCGSRCTWMVTRAREGSGHIYMGRFCLHWEPPTRWPFVAKWFNLNDASSVHTLNEDDHIYFGIVQKICQKNG